jgi:lantibiotic modifying enzyme
MSPRVSTLYPNFSHGTAGVAYALASLFGVTGDRDLLDAALAGARYLEAVEVSHDGGCRVFHHEPDGSDLFYLSWCHGGPGTARLFEQLGSVTGDDSWADRIVCHARGVTQMGAPVGRSKGYWNNISQCCGNAGVGEFFLTLHRQSPDRGYLDIARRAADDILKRATEVDGGLKWVQAEHRVRPELLVAQTGRMQGAAGVGSFFLHLDAWNQGKEMRIMLPDSPWL